MKPSPCQSLDDFLAHDLTGSELGRFTAHLSSCADCEQAVREQQRLDVLLSEAVIRLDPAPAGLIENVRRRLRVSRVRRVAVFAAGLAAAVAAIWLLGHFLPRRDLPQSPGGQVEVEPPPVDVPRSPGHVRVTFSASADVMAVRENLDSPNVTVIRVYPGLRKAPQSAPTEEDSPATLERNEP